MSLDKPKVPKSVQLPQPSPEPRRGFMAKFSATVIGSVLGLAPLAAGLVVFFDPLRRASRKTIPIRLTTLDSLPDDGVPRQFPVVTDHQDAWNLYRNEPIGAVYLVREPGSDKVVAFNATCPHAGCLVDFQPQKKQFACPCHKSLFTVTGARIDPDRCPSPRDLDTLECDVRSVALTANPAGPPVQEVWVEFQDFQITKAEKIPKA